MTKCVSQNRWKKFKGFPCLSGKPQGNSKEAVCFITIMSVWDVISYSPASRYQHFRGLCWHHLKDNIPWNWEKGNGPWSIDCSFPPSVIDPTTFPKWLCLIIKVEALCFSEMLVTVYQFSLCCIPDDHISGTYKMTLTVELFFWTWE